MTQQNEINQIEYRWEDQQDLVPIASSMSPHAKQSWNALISSWVRHPDAEVTPESVRYQLLPDGRAVLAWRYRDPEAAKREDGTDGRPIVSRVFVAQQGQLTPDIAIVLCRAGLPASAGPRPGEVASGDELPPLRVEQLRNLTGYWATIMDREAALEPGLAQLLTAALAEPGLPLAVQLRLPDISNPPGNGPQPRLLWGMWRIGWPLLGDSGRGWSFSTFEEPLGKSDPARLPDIVFRLDQQLRHAPAMSRDERRVSPYRQGAPAAPGRYPEISDWLVREYATRGGDELGGLLAECGPGAPYHARLDAVYERMWGGRRPRHAAASIPEPEHAETAEFSQYDQRYEHDLAPEPERGERDDQPVQHEQYHAERRESGTPAVSREPEQEAPPEPHDTRRRYRATEYQPPASEPVKYTLAGFHAAQAAAQAAAERQQAPSPPVDEEPADRQVPKPEFRPRLDLRYVSTVSELLRMLTTASDAQEFESVLQRIRIASEEFSQSDRRQAFREMQANSWYIPHLLHYDYVPCEDELAGIFRQILLPDLELEQVQRQMAQWILEAGPEHTTRTLIRALLLTPHGDEARRRMRSLLRPALAVRLIIDYDSTDLWPSEPDRRDSDPSGSGTSGRRRIFSRGGKD